MTHTKVATSIVTPNVGVTMGGKHNKTDTRPNDTHLAAPVHCKTLGLSSRYVLYRLMRKYGITAE